MAKKNAATATYVYCVVAAPRAPRRARSPAGLPGAGRVRLLDLDRGLYLVAADVPLARYGEAAIERGLSDLDWVSRAAVAHEAVVESFIDATAVLPMKLFTIFNNDARAIEHVRAAGPRASCRRKGVRCCSTPRFSCRDHGRRRSARSRRVRRARCRNTGTG